MEYLLEEYLFSDEDIRLNADTLLWPRNIGPIFDTNDEVSFISQSSSKAGLYREVGAALPPFPEEKIGSKY